ncbi:MAG: Rpn family recombination-promoting nuclease/putative transposase [Planctomycetes bacterium]|nr:Rpn family recombination-promoting nuclease/putative transposase [Planctomycetota bacterium]
MGTPHDDYFHFTMQDPRLAAAWLRSALPRRLLRAIDWSSLTRAPEKLRGDSLRHRITDLLFTARLRDGSGTVWIVIEHKSGDDNVEAQIGCYVAYLINLPPDADCIPPIPVVAVLFHHGRSPSPRHRTKTGASLFYRFRARMLRRLVLHRDDVSRSPEAELRDVNLPAQVQLLRLGLRFLRDFAVDQVLLALDRWADLLRAVDREPKRPGRDPMAAFWVYCLEVTDVAAEHLQGALERILERPETDIMGTLQKTEQRGFERGLAEGKLEGLAEGKLEGKAEGKLEGETRGRVATLIRLLERRFGSLPDHVSARLAAGSIADLDRWADRVLDVPRLDLLFAD